MTTATSEEVKALEKRLRQRLQIRWGAVDKIGEPHAMVDYDDLRSVLCVLASLTALETEREGMREAIRWALGEGDSDFSDKIPKARAWRYWWREELRRRAFPIPKPDIEG